MNKPISFVETPYPIANLMVQLITKPKSSEILDTGSGKGVFIECLINNGYKNIEGIEIYGNYARYCEEKYNITIYNKNYLTFSPNKKYDVIIGNPPYNHYNALPDSIRENIANITKTKESDIYYAFILKSIELLKDGGELIYIVPYSFFYNTYAKIVRETILKNGHIELIIDLDETRLFKGENPETIIFKFVKKKSNNNEKLTHSNIKILKIIKKGISPESIYNKAIESLQYKKSNDVFKYYEKEHFKNSNTWSSYNTKIDIKEYIFLKDVANVCVGLVSGFEEGFRIGDDEQYTSKESELIKKFVKAKNCKGYYVDGFVKYLLTNDIPSEDYLKEYPKYITNS
jgi:adenine-specific DNA-methyltransferase